MVTKEGLNIAFCRHLLPKIRREQTATSKTKNGSTRERIVGDARCPLSRSPDDCLLSSFDVDSLERLIARGLRWRWRRTLLPHLLAMRRKLGALCISQHCQHL
jgi:hypothetical protein